MRHIVAGPELTDEKAINREGREGARRKTKQGFIREWRG
jgi:hypothetical protein